MKVYAIINSKGDSIDKRRSFWFHLWNQNIYINDLKIGRHIKRTFKERFFSWPWKPWKRTYFDPNSGEYIIPTGQIIKAENGSKLFMNSHTKTSLDEAIEEFNKIRKEKRNGQN